LPDFGAVLGVECSEGGEEALAFVLKFFYKQGMFLTLVAVYGLLYLINKAACKRRAVQAMGASYSLLFVMYAKNAFGMTATTGVEGFDGS